ncbi:hypothetical protein Q1695_004628 [Nippostrongylus brasiliensis]|nr:hypothetical protein Q1695_004628 [Nippostrongylus brasiliensis]
MFSFIVFAAALTVALASPPQYGGSKCNPPCGKHETCATSKAVCGPYTCATFNQVSYLDRSVLSHDSPAPFYTQTFGPIPTLDLTLR